jgi:hypothetical protein
MVEFSLSDYNTILKWFEMAFGGNMDKLKVGDRRVFWKISFFAEDLLNELAKDSDDD